MKQTTRTLLKEVDAVLQTLPCLVEAYRGQVLPFIVDALELLFTCPLTSSLVNLFQVIVKNFSTLCFQVYIQFLALLLKVLTSSTSKIFTDVTATDVTFLAIHTLATFDFGPSIDFTSSQGKGLTILKTVHDAILPFLSSRDDIIRVEACRAFARLPLLPYISINNDILRSGSVRKGPAVLKRKHGDVSRPPCADSGDATGQRKSFGRFFGYQNVFEPISLASTREIYWLDIVSVTALLTSPTISEGLDIQKVFILLFFV